MSKRPSRKDHLVIGLTLGLSLFFFPTIEFWVRRALVNDYRLLTGRLWTKVTEVGETGTGLEVFARNVRDSVEMIRAQNLTGFRYSKGLESDWTYTQRLVDHAYPTQVRESASAVLYREDENWPSDCRILDQKGGIVLVRCP